MNTAAGSATATLESLANHLGRLDHAAALAVVEQARSSGMSVSGLITGLLAPALVEVGRRWAAGEVGAAEALGAAAIVRAALPRIPMPPGQPSQQTVAVCCPPGEHHEIPAEMITELLRDVGCAAQHIGAGVTPKHLPGFLSRQRPAALLVSCTTPCGLPGAARSIEVAHAYGVPVIVGGAAFGRDDMLALRLGAAAWAQTPQDVVRAVESWFGRSAVLPGGRALTEEYLMFEAGLPEIRAAAAETLRRLPADPDAGDDGPGGVAATQDRLELLLRHLGAALLVDDGRLFLDFVSWRAEYYRNRQIGPARLGHSLSSVLAALPAEFGRARRFVDEGRQHFSWLTRSEAHGSGWSGADALIPDAAPKAPALSEAGGPSAPAGAAAGPLRVTAGGVAPPAPGLPGLRPGGAGGKDQPGRVFADLLFVAATTCHAPYALISVAQPNGRWSTLGHGIERRDLMNDDRLFAHVGRASDPIELGDLSRYPELAAGPLGRGPLGVRYVYGMPLRNRQNALLGVLCILDRRPRELSARERQALVAVSRQVASQLAQWRRAAAAGGPGGPAGPVGVVAGANGTGPGRPLGGAGGGLNGAGFAGVVPALRAEPAAFGDDDRPGIVRPAETPEQRTVLQLHRERGEELLRSHEVAVLFDVTDRTVINWAAAGKLPSIRTAGGHLRFRGEDVVALLTGRSVSA